MAKLLVVGLISGLTELIETSGLKEIVDTPSGAELIFKDPYRGRLQVDDPIADLYDQQDGDLYDLGMVLVTESSTGREVILFTENFDAVGVVQEKDKTGVVIGSKIIQKDQMKNYVVDELIAAIYAQQKAGVNLGMNLVTRSSDSEPLIVMDKHINYITDEVVNAVTSTYVVLKTPNGKIQVDETCAAIQAAQSA